MTGMIFALILLLFLLFRFLRSVFHRRTRIFGVVFLAIALLCFGLYSFGITGVGLSSWIVKIFEKMGMLS